MYRESIILISFSGFERRTLGKTVCTDFSFFSFSNVHYNQTSNNVRGQCRLLVLVLVLVLAASILSTETLAAGYFIIVQFSSHRRLGIEAHVVFFKIHCICTPQSKIPVSILLMFMLGGVLGSVDQLPR